MLAALVSLTDTLACGGATPVQPPASSTAATAVSRPTDSFRREHAEIKEHLGHIKVEVGKLATAPSEEQRASLEHVVRFFREHIKPHAEWEEHVLYPAVDKRAAPGSKPFTASMRYEHRIVARWTDELASMASSTPSDVTGFARRADNLLGLLWAHFEEEEEVLLPILDQTMSKEDFDREIGSRGE